MTRLRDVFSLAWLEDTAVRAIKTFAQTLLGVLVGASAGTTFGVFDVDWQGALNVSLFAALTALLMAVSGGQAVPAQPVQPAEQDTDGEDLMDYTDEPEILTP